MSHALILGGSGFFGKSILDAYRRGLLNEQGIDRITIVSRHATDLKKYHPDLIGQSVKLEDANLLTCDSLPSADLVIHAAASTDAERYALHPEEERNNIIDGISQFCKIARTNFEKSKILYISSGAVYGDYSHVINNISEDYPIEESSPIADGKLIYTLAKRDCERLIQNLGADGLDVSIARCFAFVGKYLPRDQHFAIGNFIQNGLNKMPIEVKASSLVYRSYMDADDLARWLMVIALSADSSSKVFNVGSDDAISIQELAQKVAQYFDVDVNLAPINSKNISRYVPSISKAKNQLGLTLGMNLDQSIEATINSIRGI